MVWVVVVLVVVALAAPGAGAWYVTGRQLAATTDAQRWRLVRLSALVSAGVGVAILILGVVGFVIAGYDWLVLAVLWSFGALHLGLLASTYRRWIRRKAAGPGATR